MQATFTLARQGTPARSPTKKIQRKTSHTALDKMKKSSLAVSAEDDPPAERNSSLLGLQPHGAKI